MEDVGKLIKQASRRLRQGAEAPDFFELVRRIERHRPDFPRLGKAFRPTQENIRFGQTPYLRFPATDISDITPMAGDVEALVMTYFFGKKAGKIATKQAAKSFNLISVVADFILGADDCRNILGIIKEKPSVGERLAGGLINCIPSIISSISQIIAGASFGAAIPISVAIYTLSVIATVIISIDSIRSMIIC